MSFSDVTVSGPSCISIDGGGSRKCLGSLHTAQQKTFKVVAKNLVETPGKVSFIIAATGTPSAIAMCAGTVMNRQEEAWPEIIPSQGMDSEKVKPASNTRTTYVYDADGRIAQVRDICTVRTTSVYNASGILVAIIDAQGNRTNIPLDRKTERSTDNDAQTAV